MNATVYQFVTGVLSVVAYDEFYVTAVNVRFSSHISKKLMRYSQVSLGKAV